MNLHSNLSFSTVKFISLFIMLACFGYANAQDNNVITFDVGSFTITLLSEGQQQGNQSILTGATEMMLKQAIPDGTFPNATNAFLVKAGNKTVLFDTGYGKNLFDNLKKLGKTTANIDAIVLTHMHGDHIGGLLRNGKKAFPSAELYISKPEYDYWMSDAAGNATQARNVINAYKDKLHLFTPGSIEDAKELFPGIRSVAAYGHTPGHTGYMVESNGSKLFIWGDLTHAMAIQMPFPEVAVTYDVDPKKAVESRLKLLKYLSDNNIRIAGMHIQFPAIGNVKKNKSNGYEFTLICDCEGRYE
jgi:glyoxylase-like metal-dependent hydrolase (beta-lactamase superfamily II)